MVYFERSERPERPERPDRKFDRERGGEEKIIRKKRCRFCVDHVEKIDYKDSIRLRKNLTERGKIIPRRITGNCAHHQRQVAEAVKRARYIALIPSVIDQ